MTGRVGRMSPSGSLTLGLALLFAASACRRDEKPRPPAKPKPVASAPSTPSAAPTPTGSEKPPPSTPEQAAALRTVRAWSDALDRHDLEALAELYAPTV